MSDDLETKKRRFKLVCAAESKQRKREEEALRFRNPENQWDEQAKRERGGTTGSPARPMVSVSLLDQPINLTQNQATNAKTGIEVHPVSEKADPEVADVKQNLYRRIERDSNASLARMWAFNRAIQCGRGWYEVTTEWDEDGDDPFDQEIRIKRVLDGQFIYMDPAAQEPDYSDAEWGFKVAWVKRDDFLRQYPDASMGPDSLGTETPDEPEWVREEEGGDRSILVARHWYKHHDRAEVRRGGRVREKDKVTVWRCTMTGYEVLDEEDTRIAYIPLIPVIGTEHQPVDGERRWDGIIGPAMHGQKIFNYGLSGLIERAASEPRTPWVMAEGQDEGHEQEWQYANLQNRPVLFYNPKVTGPGGQPLPPPQRAQLDQTGMSQSMLLVNEGRSLVQDSTQFHDASLAKTTNTQESGRKILALQQQADAGNSHFVANLQNISLPYEARVVLALMPIVYDRPGRVVQVLGEDDDAKAVMLGRPFVMDQDGRPRAAKPREQGAKTIDLRAAGKYSTSVRVGRSYQTKMQEGDDAVSQILTAVPNLIPVLGDLWMSFKDIPGARQMADRLSKMREHDFPWLTDQEEGQQPTPEQLQAQNQALQAQLQQAQQQLQQLSQQLQTDAVKAQATLQKAQIDAQGDAQVATIKASSEQQIAQLEANLKLMLAEIEGRLTGLEAQKGRDHEAALQGFSDRHETDMHHEDLAHEAAMAAATPPDLTYSGGADQPLPGGE